MGSTKFIDGFKNLPLNVPTPFSPATINSLFENKELPMLTQRSVNNPYLMCIDMQFDFYKSRGKQ